MSDRRSGTTDSHRPRPNAPRRLLLLAAALLLLLAACATDDTDAVVDDPVDDDDVVVDDDPTDDDDDVDAEPDEGLFAGETIEFVVPFDPGGGFDAQARLIAPFLEEELGATVVVDNQPGAGGFLAINNLATVEPDGTTIALMNLGAFIGAALADDPGVQIDITELSYVGRIFGGPVFAVVAADSPFETWEDVMAADNFRFGTTGVGSSNHVTADVLMQVFDIQGELIPGFDSSAELELAVVAQNVEGMTGSFDSRLPSIDAGETRALLQLGDEPHEAIPDVPMALDFDLSEEDEAIIRAHTDLQLLFRAIVAPPGVPEDRLRVLQETLEKILNDPDFIAESEAQGRPMLHMHGDPLLERVVDVLENAPDAYRALMAEG